MSIFIVSLAVVLVYLYGRTGQINSINAEIARVKAEKVRMSQEKPDQGNWGKMFPERAGVALFVEDLFDAAQMSGIKKHEVSTVRTGAVPERKNVTKGKTGEDGKILKTYSLTISLEGNYRETAEYIREVQNIRRYKRIVALGMKPADKMLKTDITIEVVSLEGKDAAE